MPTHYHYAVFSQQVYTNAGGTLTEKMQQEGWEIYKTDYNPQNFKFAVAAYINKKSKEVVVAFRGTIISFENLVTDLFLFSNHYPNTFGYAKLFIKELLEKLVVENILINGISEDDVEDKQYFNLSFTGHSLGSIFAEILACQLGLKAVTFESPGSKHIIDDDADSLQQIAQGYSPHTNIDCYLSAPNAINTFKLHVGRLYRMYVDHVEPGLSFSYVCESILGSAGRVAVTVGAAATTITVGPATGAIAAAPNILATGAQFLDKAAECVDSSSAKNAIKYVSDATKAAAATLSLVEAAKGVTQVAASGYSAVKTLVSNPLQSSSARTLSSLSQMQQAANELNQGLKNIERIASTTSQLKRPLPATLLTGRPVKVASYLVMKNGQVYNLMINPTAQQVILNSGNVSRVSGYFLQNEQELRNLFQTALTHQPIGNIDWLYRQHSIDNIVKLFDPNTGKINKRSIIEQWPIFSESTIKSFIDKTATGLVPFHPANPSIPNLIWSNENNVIEEQVKRIAGYKVKEEQAPQPLADTNNTVAANADLSDDLESDGRLILRR